MHKKFEINRTKIKGGFQSGRKVVTHDSKSDIPLDTKNSWKSLTTNKHPNVTFKQNSALTCIVARFHITYLYFFKKKILPLILLL